MMEEELRPSIHHAKKSARSRRRLHEAEVLSTTPCTAPRRSPQGQPLNVAQSPVRRRLEALQVSHRRDSRLHTSASGTSHEYNRISNKTGGFEGSLPLQYDVIFSDDDTVHFNNTVKSSPEIGNAGRQLNGGRDTSTSRNRIFQLRRRLTFVDREHQPQHRGFFNRWASIGSASNHSNVASSSIKTTSLHGDKQQSSAQPRPSKLTLSSRATTTFTVEDNSDKSLTKSQSQVVTPSRSRNASSPRFILPDETPPGSAKNGRSKGSTADNTSAAVVARQSPCSSPSDDQGFELSIASAPPVCPSPHKKRSTPVDLDDIEAEASSDESAIHKIQLTDEGPRTHRQRASTIFSATRSLSPSKRRPNEVQKSPSRRGARGLVKSVGLTPDPDDDMSKFSAKPLHSMDDLKLKATAPVRQHQPIPESERSKRYSSLKNWVVPIRRKDSHSSTAVSLLERDRFAAMKVESKIPFLEKQERLLEERNGQHRLGQQQKPKSDEVQSLSPDQRESIFANMELVEKHSSAETYQTAGKSRSANYTQSTNSSSKDAVKLPRCVVCNGRDRTHIAIPCMHFAYCRECAMRLAKTGRGCVLCSNQHVTFAAVSV
jgi:Zinc finger, C3HC4 type (RING finger)